MQRLSDLLLRYLHYVDGYVANRNQQALLDCLEADSQALLLDCGCHAGANAHRRAEAKGLRAVAGIELNTTVAREAVARGLWVMQADLNRPLPLVEGCVDAAMVSDVLEHLAETGRFVAEVHRVLKSGGYAVVSTPNLASWHNIAALLVGLQPFSGPHLTHYSQTDVGLVRRLRQRTCQSLAEQGWAEVEDEATMYRHVVVAAYRSLRRHFEAQGFTVERTVAVGYYPLPPALERLMTRLDPWHASHIVLKVRKGHG
jgi:SAM-dependent methyltransferase